MKTIFFNFDKDFYSSVENEAYDLTSDYIIYSVNSKIEGSEQFVQYYDNDRYKEFFEKDYSEDDLEAAVCSYSELFNANGEIEDKDKKLIAIVNGIPLFVIDAIVRAIIEKKLAAECMLLHFDIDCWLGVDFNIFVE